MADPAPLPDLLMDLVHDLGKYIRMPLAFLPADAPPSEVHAALVKGLLHTRPGPVSARALWERFLAEAGPLPRRAPYAEMTRAVEKALAWEAVARDPGANVVREELDRDLAAVGKSIRAALADAEEHA